MKIHSNQKSYIFQYFKDIHYTGWIFELHTGQKNHWWIGWLKSKKILIGSDNDRIKSNDSQETVNMMNISGTQNFTSFSVIKSLVVGLFPSRWGHQCGGLRVSSCHCADMLFERCFPWHPLMTAAEAVKPGTHCSGFHSYRDVANEVAVDVSAIYWMVQASTPLQRKKNLLSHWL